MYHGFSLCNRVMWHLLLLVCVVSAGQITARSPVMFLSDGKLWQNQTLEVRCDATDSDLAYTLNGQTLQVTCLPPQYVYELQLAGEVPRSGQYNLIRSCKTRGSNALNASLQLQRQLTVSNAELSPSARRLLQVTLGNRYLLPEDIPINDWYFTTFGSTRVGNRSVTLFETIVACYGSTSAAIACEAKIRPALRDKWNEFTKCSAAEGRPGLEKCNRFTIDESTFETLCGYGTRDCQDARAWRKRSPEEQALFATRLSFRAFMQATSAWQEGVTNDIGDLTAMDQRLLDLINATGRDARNLTNQLHLMLNDLNSQMDAQANMTRDMFIERAKTYNAQINETAVNARRDAELLEQRINDPSLLEEARAGIMASIRNQYQLLDNLSAAMVFNMEDFEDIVHQRFRIQTNENRDMYRTLREFKRGFADDLQGRGFLKDLIPGVRRSIQSELLAGRHPFLVDTGVEAKFPWDQNALFTIEAVRALYRTQSSLDVYVGHQEDWAFVCDSPYLVSQVTGGLDWFQLLSDVGPPGCDPTTPRSCQCFVRMRERTCTLRSNYGATNAWSNLLALNDEDCATGVTLAPDRIFTTPVEFIVAANQLCAAVSGDNITLAAHYQNRRASFDVDEVACAATFDELDNVGLTTHPLVGLLGYFELGFNSAMVYYDALFDSMYGALPIGVEIIERAIARQDAQAARCVMAAFMTLEEDFLPVYRVVPVTVEAAIEVRIDGILVSRTSDVALHTTLDALLPGAEYVVIGDPRNNTLVYDVPQNEISLAPGEYSRRGKATYVFFPPGTEKTAAAWVERHGTLPTQSAAQNLPYLYQARVENGRCVTVPLAAGSWCSIRDRFDVVPVPSNSSRLAFAARSGSVLTGSVVVPMGDITQQVFNVCPVMQSVAQGGGTQLTFISPVANGPRALNLTLIVHFADVCDTLFTTFQLAPGASFSLFVPRCGDTAHASLFRGADGEGEPCLGVQNTDLVPAMNDYRSVYGNYDVPRVNLTQAVSNDEILLLLQRMETTVTERMLGLLTGYVNGKTFQGLPIKADAFASFLASMRNVSSGPLFPDLPTRTAATYLFTVEDYERQSAAYAARVAQSAAALEGFQGTADAFMAAAIAQQNTNVQNLINTRNQTDLLGRAAEAYSADYVRSINGLAAMSNAQAGANSILPVPGWKTARENFTRSFHKTLAANDSAAIAEAYSAPGMDEALKRQLGFFATSMSFWGSFAGVVVINAIVTFILSYNLVKEDTMLSFRCCRDGCRKATCSTSQ